MLSARFIQEKKGWFFLKKAAIIFVALISLLLVMFGCTQGQGQQINMALLTSPAAGVMGSSQAPVTIVEYSDFQCVFCRQWFLESKQKLIDEYVASGKVKFEFKDLPLVSIHPMAVNYAAASRCAGDQGKYWEMHDALYNKQDELAKGELITITTATVGDVVDWARELGIDSNEFTSCLVSAKFDSAIQSNASEATNVNIRGTPAFVIGKTGQSGELVSGVITYEQLKQKIDALLK